MRQIAMLPRFYGWSGADGAAVVEPADTVSLYSVVYYEDAIYRYQVTPDRRLRRLRNLSRGQFMSSPPFQLARAARGSSAQSSQRHEPGQHTQQDAGAYLRFADACCTPSDQRTPPVARRRTRLHELDSHLQCSIVGTCMSTGELRRLVPKYTSLDRQHASDLDIHHAAVELAIAGGAGGKALQKVLDERHAAVIRRFAKERDEVALLALWKDALKSGDVPPAYWAIMCHPDSTLSLRQAAFGDVHMLSHLVGAANRADIRRLVALENENADLQEKIGRQQSRLQEIATQRDETIRRLTQQVVQLSARADASHAGLSDDERAHVEGLQSKLAQQQQRLAVQTALREAAERRALHEQEASTRLRSALEETLQLLGEVQAECKAMEAAALGWTGQAEDSQGTQLAGLQGKRILYVGGRPSSNTTLKALVESHGGRMTLHDGGIEDRKGLLAAALPNADVVIFPVDCVGHDAMHTLKRLCERYRIAFHPVRTASVASFVQLVGQIFPADEGQAVDAESGKRDALSTGPLRKTAMQTERVDVDTGRAAVSRFCLRHG